MSQIAAQITKVNSWDNLITKVDILSFVPPEYRGLVPAIDLIYILQNGTHDGTVSLLVLGWAPFGLSHSLYPSGHALNEISAYIPPLVFYPNPPAPAPKAQAYPQQGPYMH